MMKRDDIIKGLAPYFKVQELVCNHIYAKWKESSWRFLDTAFLETLLVLRRDIFKSPMYCNKGASYQRGMRCNLCELVKAKTAPYLSAHVMGKGGDFDVDGLTAAEARKVIMEKASQLPYPIRLEDDVTWLHVDVMPFDDTKNKVNLFKS